MNPSLHNQFAPMIPGLPAGVKIVRIGLAGPNDYEFMGNKIYKGPRSGSQVIVTPNEGYEFAFGIEQNCYACRPKGAGAQTATLTFDISNPAHAAFVKGISTHPAVISGAIAEPITATNALRGSIVEIVKEPAQIEGHK